MSFSKYTIISTSPLSIQIKLVVLKVFLLKLIFGENLFELLL